MLEDIQVRNLSPNTRDSYLQQVSQFARHFGRSPEQLGPEEIRAYQVYLTNEKRLAAKSIRIAVSALRFLYTVTLKRDWPVEDVIPAPKVPQTLPVVLSPEESLHFLACIAGDQYRNDAGGSLSTAQRRVMTAIEECRTAALGGHVEQCDCCEHLRVWYNSCVMESPRFWGAAWTNRRARRAHTPVGLPITGVP
jgi:hypothetical protein